MLRRLRIVASVLCLAVGAAVAILWVRSYKYWDEVRCRLPNGEALQLYTTEGRIAWRDWGLPADEDYPHCYRCYFAMNEQKKQIVKPGFFYSQTPQNTLLQIPQSRSVVAPLWFPVAIMCILSVALGVRRPWKFSMRSMLVATTLIALLLGAAVALSR